MMTDETHPGEHHVPRRVQLRPSSTSSRPGAVPKRRPVGRLLLLIGPVAAVALVAGFAFGALTVGGITSTPHQASVSGTPASPPTGLSFPLAEATIVSASSTPAAGACTTSNLGTAGSPTNLTNGTNTSLCLSSEAGGYALGDTVYLIEVSWNSTAALSTEFEITVFFSVVPATNDVVAISYVQTSAAITHSETAVFTLDLTESSDSAVDGFNVLVTQL